VKNVIDVRDYSPDRSELPCSADSGSSVVNLPAGRQGSIEVLLLKIKNPANDRISVEKWGVISYFFLSDLQLLNKIMTSKFTL